LPILEYKKIYLGKTNDLLITNFPSLEPFNLPLGIWFAPEYSLFYFGSTTNLTLIFASKAWLFFAGKINRVCWNPFPGGQWLAGGFILIIPFEK
jgi:hypothetical protein